jgi:beta-phosphoglucomutase family hydrolase
MDGVIVDSGAHHFQAWQRTFAGYDIAFTMQDFKNTFGKVNKDIIRQVLREASDGLIRTLGQEKEELFRTLVAEQGATSLPGAVTLIESLDRLGFRQALASSAPRANVDLILSKLGLRQCFQAFVSEEDVTRGKPDPQPFLVAAERLGTRPEEAVVIEDAPSGVEAAHRGGMKAVGITTGHTRRELAGADLVVDSLAELNADRILQLLKEK